MPSVDLHTHSHCSDGSLAPTELVARAMQAGVELLSITDHDCVDAYAGLASGSGLQLIPGIELSTRWRKCGVHIVGLNIDLDSNPLGKLIELQSRARRQRMEHIVRRLHKLGLEVDFDALLASCGPMLGRPQLAAYLVATGQVDSEQKAFRKYLGRGKAGDLHNSWPELAEVVTVIAQAGGCAVLAHPLKYRLTRCRLHELVADFVQAGGVAMEVVCGRQIPSDTRQMEALCRQADLHASLGSDFHAPAPGHQGPGLSAGLAADLQPVWDLFAA